MGHMATASPVILPPEEPPTITCVRLSLINSTTVIHRPLRINMAPQLLINTAPQLLGPMDNHRRGLLTSMGILHSPKGRRMAKGPRLLEAREDTGVVRHLRLRVDSLELDTAPVEGNTRPDRMGSHRPAKVVGVATLRGIELHRRIGLSYAWP